MLTVSRAGAGVARGAMAARSVAVSRAAVAVSLQSRGMGVVRSGVDPKTRPVSPHVTIYAFPIAAIASVTHRITGGMLTFGAYGIGIAAIAGGDVVGIMNSVADTTGLAALSKFSIAFTTTFHTLLGTRHMYWEKFPEGLELGLQEKLSWGIFAAAGSAGVLGALL